MAATMEVLTATGGYETVSARSGWPMAGVNLPMDFSSAWSSVELSPLASGETRLASYAQIYKTNPWVWSSVHLISKGIARLPLHVFQLLDDGNRIRVRGDLPGVVGRPSGGQQLDSLLRRPAPNVSRHQLVRRTMVDQLVYGNALWVAERGPYSITNLWHVPWRRVVVHAGDKVPVLSYEVRGFRGSQFFSPDDVIHFGAGSDPEQPVGMSPLEPLRYTIRLLDAIQRHLAAFFGNQARLSGHLKVAPNTSKENLEEIRETVRQLYTSPENAGKVLVTSADWSAMAAPPGQTDVIELIRLSREEVLTAFNIPPPSAGILDHAIRSNVKELREQLLRDVIGPWAEGIESEIEAQLLPQSPSWNYLFVNFAMGEILRPDITARAEAYAKLRNIYSYDELRKLEDLPAIGTPDSQVPSVPLNERPLGLPASAYGDTSQPGTEPEETPAEDPEVPGEEDLDDEDDDLV